MHHTKRLWLAAVVTALAIASARFFLTLPRARGRDAPASPAATAPASTQPMVLDLGERITLKLMPIAAGHFTMGSPANEPGRVDDETQHEVTLTKPFFIGRTLITQAQYKAVMGANPSQVNRRDDYPVDSVSWNDAVEFCKQLSKRSGKTVSLPTEAQWEYACRAGTATRFFCGDDEKQLRQYALFWARTDLPVGHFKPNDWGLYDMLGLLHEWCADA